MKNNRFRMENLKPEESCLSVCMETILGLDRGSFPDFSKWPFQKVSKFLDKEGYCSYWQAVYYDRETSFQDALKTDGGFLGRATTKNFPFILGGVMKENGSPHAVIVDQEKKKVFDAVGTTYTFITYKESEGSHFFNSYSVFPKMKHWKGE